MNAVDFILLFLIAAALFAALKFGKNGCCGDCSDCKKSGKDKNDRYKKNRPDRRL